MWVTHDGGFCHINGRPLRTRLFAGAIRLLLSLLRLRRERWAQAECDYMHLNKVTKKEFEQSRKEIDSAETKRKSEIQA